MAPAAAETGRRRFERQGRTLLLLVLAAIALALSPASSATSASAHTATKLPPRLLITVHARIRVFGNPQYPRNSELAEREVTFTPHLINVGSVRIIVANSDQVPHWFEINGVTSKRIGAGGRTVIVVKFKRPGLYPAAVTGDTPANFSGELRVIK